MMTTLKERFEQKFPNGIRLQGAVFTFFRQELLALADELEKEQETFGASIIRSKADELV